MIGHVPKLMALRLTVKRQREIYSKGQASNRGGDYCPEIPCENTFEGDSLSIIWLKHKLIEEKFLAKK